MSPVNINKASGIMIQAKRAFAEEVNAKANKKFNKTAAMVYGGTAAGGATVSVLNACNGNVGAAIGGGLMSAYCGAVAGARTALFVKTSKEAKEASQAFSEITKKKEFNDVLNRYFRIHKVEKMTPEKFVEAAKEKQIEKLYKNMFKWDKRAFGWH